MNLQQARDLIHGKRNFLETKLDGELDGLVLFNYVGTAKPSLFKDGRQELRGIIFDESTGEIVSRPFHKFFNFGEEPGTDLKSLAYKPFKVYEKIDGTMIHFFKWDGRIHAASRSGDTVHSRKAMEIAKSMNMVDEIGREIDLGYTPIFEMVGPSNKIVVNYEKDCLIYLNSRRRDTGEYRRSRTYFGSRSLDVGTMQGYFLESLVSKTIGKEGYVACSKEGVFYKAKTGWYLDRHKLNDIVSKKLSYYYEAAINGVLDDLIPDVRDDEVRDKLKRISDQVAEDVASRVIFVHETGEALRKEVNQALPNAGKRERSKKFAEIVKERYADSFDELMSFHNGKPNVEHIIKTKLLDRYLKQYDRSF